MNSQISSHRRPALGALLMVLSASTILAQSNNVPFKGAFDARVTGVVQFPTLLLNGGGNRVGDDLRIGAGIGCRHLDRRRRDIGILRDRQGKERDRTRQHDDDG